MGFLDSIFSRRKRVAREIEGTLGFPASTEIPRNEVRTIAALVSRLRVPEKTFLSPQRLHDLQQRHLEVVFENTRLHGGAIHLIQQDSVICLFNAWVNLINPALHALRTGIAIINKTPIQSKGDSKTIAIELGIGVDFGSTLRANVGDEARKAVTFFGHPLHRAEKLSRIALSRVLITESVAKEVQMEHSTLDWRRTDVSPPSNLI